MPRSQAELRVMESEEDLTADTVELEESVPTLLQKMEIEVPAPWEILIRSVHSLVNKRKMTPARAEWFISTIVELTEEATRAGDVSVLVWGGKSATGDD